MIPITPEMTAEQLRSLSENIKSTIVSLTSDLEAITNAIDAKNKAHKAEVENLKNKHAAELAALIENHEDLTELVENNTAFISTIKSFFGE